MLDYTISITQIGGTAWIKTELNSIAIDGSDYPNDNSWQAAVLKQVKEFLYDLKMEDI